MLYMYLQFEIYSNYGKSNNFFHGILNSTVTTVLKFEIK